MKPFNIIDDVENAETRFGRDREIARRFAFAGALFQTYVTALDAKEKSFVEWNQVEDAFEKAVKQTNSLYRKPFVKWFASVENRCFVLLSNKGEAVAVDPKTLVDRWGTDFASQDN